MKNSLLFILLILISFAGLSAQSSIRVQAASLLEDTPIAGKWLYLTGNNEPWVLDSIQTDAKGLAVFENLTAGKSILNLCPG